MELKDIVGKYDVLCVEDNPTIRLTMQFMLKDIFNIVDVAEDGKKGIEASEGYFQTHNKYYDIIFTDVNMPVMNGLEFTKEIKKINPDQQVLVISAHNEADILESLIEAGATDYLFKPISADALVEKIMLLISKL